MHRESEKFILGRYFIAKHALDAEGRTRLTIGIGDPAENSEIVRDAVETLRQMRLPGGSAILIDGRTTVAAGMAVAHAIAHLYGYVAYFDPKAQRFVVAISHDPAARPGDWIGA